MYRRTLAGVSVALILAGVLAAQSPKAQVPTGQVGLVVGRNVNMVSGTSLPDGDPFLQRQNEPSIAASTRNPLHLVGGANDYRTVDLPGLPDDIETGDAWLGVFKSFDGGQRWQSTLLPGYPQDASCDPARNPAADPTRCALFGYQAGADPVVRAGTNGLLYYGGLVFDRTDQSRSAVFVARFIDNNNKENGDPIAHLGTSIVAEDDGLTGRFLDKPWIAVDVPRAKAPACRIVTPPRTGADPVAPQTIEAGNVYAAYTVITGPMDSPDRSDIYLSTSSDCGVTWSPAVRLSQEQDRFNQGATIAVDPRNGHVYVAWRRIGIDDEDADAFMVTRSTNLGRRFSNPGAARRFPRGKALGLDPVRYFEHRRTRAPVVAADEAEFDQATDPDWLTFRTNAYPSMTVGRDGRVYLAWAERGFATMRPDPLNGDARIVVATSHDGQSWTSPHVVEDTGEPGHQLMPTIGLSGGRLVVAYYDLREDRSQAFATLVDDLTAIANVHPDGTRHRHTIDLRAAMGTPGDVPAFDASTRVSEYRLGTLPSESGPPYQLQWNPPNFPLFRQGTVPFIGDYIDLTPAPAFVQAANGKWEHNSGATAAPVVHAVWTDNRDVRPPLNGDWTSYTPPTSAFTNTTCADGRTGMRNQNIYTARLTQGLLAGSPGNTKPLSPDFPRGFVVFAQNTTDQVRTFRLSILAQPPGGWASFLQEPPLLPWVDATVPPRSVVSRTAYVASTDPHARVAIDVEEIAAPGAPTPLPNGLRSQVILNPDISNPDISNPDISNPDISNPDISNAEVYNPDISNPDISNPDISNPDISNPDISNPDISNVRLANPDISNPDISNPDISNPDISNPDISNPDISNPDISNGAMTDVTWTVTNTGNTAATFDVDLFLNQQTVPQGIKVQLVLHRVYKTPVADGCDLRSEAHNVLIESIIDPVFRYGTPGAVPPDPANPDISNATMWIEPGGEAKITLRILDTDLTDANTLDPVTDVTPVVTSEALNTADIGTPTPVQPADWPGATVPPSTLTFLTQPSTTNLGLPVVPAVQVQALDGVGTALPGVTVTLAFGTSPSGGHLVGTTTRATDASGVATFAGLWVDREGIGYRLVASAGSIDAGPVASAPFAVLSSCAAGTPVESRVEGPDIDSHPFALKEALNTGGDAHRDMIVLHENGLVTLMTGTGTGSFDIRFQTPIPGGSGPRSLAVADVNGDGNSDAIVGFATSGNVGVMLGDGAGFVLGMPTTVAAGGAVHDVAIGQFNPLVDAYPDLALTFEDGSDVRVLYGNGTGGFGPPQTVAVAGGSFGVLAVGRMNPDGRDDLVVATPGAPGAATVLLSGGGGIFTPTATAVAAFDPASVVAADLDGNGLVDVAVADPTTSAVRLFLGNGAGGLSPWASVFVAGGPRSIVSGYFDGNAAIDLATANPDDDTFAILFNDGAAGFAVPVTFAAADEPSGIAAGDFNGDGAMDLAVANRLRTGPYETISALVNPCLPGATSVTGTGDSGPGSLREAIRRANANVGFADTIAFAIPGAGPHTIAPTSVLPVVTDPAIIDGFTQAGAGPGTLEIELSGASTPGGVDGLTITAGGSLVRGLAVNRFLHGIWLQGGGGNRITGNHLGTDVTGSVALGNADTGVAVWNSPNNVIGGTSPAERNVVAGNAGAGVSIRGSTGNVVLGNYIGTDATGLSALPNLHGVSLAGGAAGNTVGGTTAGSRNVISGNLEVGVTIWEGATANIVEGNGIGTNAPGTAALPNQDGVSIDSSSGNVVGGTTAGAGNVIAGNLFDGVAIVRSSGDSQNNRVEGNYIGLRADGTALGNGKGGVHLSTYGASPHVVSNNVIGGSATGAGNVISANDYGVAIDRPATSDNVVEGNLVGTDPTGLLDRGNVSGGILVEGGATGNRIRDNVVSGNDADGIALSTGAVSTIVEDNLVGTTAGGDVALGNLGSGISLDGAATTMNILSGNTVAASSYHGVDIRNHAHENWLTGNYLGTNAAHATGLGNAHGGVRVEDGAGNGIGRGGSPGNVMAYNGISGVILQRASNDVVQGNTIVHNASAGVVAGDSTGITIGGDPAGGYANEIAFNGIGVEITGTSSGVAVTQNAIHDNVNLGIDLGLIHADGVTYNDPGDADAGPNGLVNFPVLSAALSDGSAVRVDGTVDVGVAGATLRIEFFASPTCDASTYGEGAEYLGYTAAVTGGGGTAVFAGVALPLVPDGWSITATTTSPVPGGSTSEFSACQVVTSPLAFTTLPSGATAGAAFGVTVHAEDNTGSPLPGVTVVLTIGSGPTGAVLSGGTILATDGWGDAAFTGLSLNLPGTYTLVATSGTVTMTSIPFVVSP